MDRLRAIAMREGFFTRTDVLEAGFDDRTIRRHLRLRIWVRLRHGAYTFSELWPDDPVAQHVARGRAVVHKLGSGAAASHTTAAAAHQLRLWAPNLDTVHVTRLDDGAPRLEAGVQHHVGRLAIEDLVDLDGLRAVGATRAALETTALHGTEAGLVVLDSLLHLELVTREHLDAAYAEMAQWPGMLHVGVAVRLAHGGGQSVGESRGRYAFYVEGIPAPELQWHVFDELGRLVGITDFAWPEHRLLGEFDGRIKYGRLLRDGQDPGEVVFAEKKREDRLREVTGWQVIRFVWSDLASSAQMAARVRRMMRMAA